MLAYNWKFSFVTFRKLQKKINSEKKRLLEKQNKGLLEQKVYQISWKLAHHVIRKKLKILVKTYQEFPQNNKMDS